MNKILGYLKATSSRLYSHVNRYPMESIELVMASLLTFIGLLVMIPPGLLGSSSTNVYGEYIFRTIFGVSWILSSWRIIYWRYKLSMDTYIYIYQKQRRSKLFWITITWLYFTVLTLATKPLLPAYWVLYLTLTLISSVCYVRLYK